MAAARLDLTARRQNWKPARDPLERQTAGRGKKKTSRHMAERNPQKESRSCNFAEIKIIVARGLRVHGSRNRGRPYWVRNLSTGGWTSWYEWKVLDCPVVPRSVVKSTIGLGVNMSGVPKFLVGLGLHLPRARHQTGWVHETGKQVKKWKGHFYIYRTGTDGKERRHHRAVILGLKAQMRKWEAGKRLQEIIYKENGPTAPKADSDVTFGWFWEWRYFPMRSGSLRKSSKTNLRHMGKYLMSEFSDLPLSKFDKFICQDYLNRLAAKGYSHSMVSKAQTYLKAVLAEAVDQDYIAKNPAKKIKASSTKEVCKRSLSPDEIQKLLNGMEGRDRLILRIFLICGLRPGELFALCWKDWTSGQLMVDESVWKGEIGKTKTEGSMDYVTLSGSLESDLRKWRYECGSPGPEDLIFKSQRGSPIDRGIWLYKNLKPAAERAGIQGITLQALRRTFATQMQKCGTVKDAQTQLRHASPNLTAGTYMQAIPSSVREAVERLDRRLCPPVPKRRM